MFTRSLARKMADRDNEVGYEIEYLPIDKAEVTDRSAASNAQQFSGPFADSVMKNLSSLHEAINLISDQMRQMNHRSQKDFEATERRFQELEAHASRDLSQSVTAPKCSYSPSVNQSAYPLCSKPAVFDGKNLSNFLTSVENFINSNNVSDEHRIPVLVSYLGPALTWYRTWIAANPNGTYEELVAQLRIIYGTTPASLLSKVNFRNMKRRVNETFEEYLTELQEAAYIAYHGQDSATIRSAVIEQFLLGLQSPKVQEGLMRDDFTDPILLLQQAQKLRDGLKLTHSQHFVNEVSMRESSRFHPNSKRPSASIRCWNCNRIGHKASSAKCPKNVSSNCYRCNEQGHRWKDCTKPSVSGNARLGMYRDSTNPAKTRQ